MHEGGVACPQWHCRAWSNPDPGGQDLPAGAWQGLEARLTRARGGTVCPRWPCLVAVAVCAFTAAGNDRFTAVGQ